VNSPETSDYPAEPTSLTERFRLALSFLTILPFGPSQPASSEAVAASFELFPAVGLLLGLLFFFVDRILFWILPVWPRSVLIVLLWAAITGAAHLDGLADAADALGAGSNRERALEIMRDSRIGSFGAVAIFLVLTLKCAALAQLSGSTRSAALIVTPILGRWAMVEVSYKLDYLRKEGAGSVLLSSLSRRSLFISHAIAIAAMTPFMSWRTGAVVVIVELFVAALRPAFRAWMGGVTGDLIGAADELVEALALLAFAA